MMESTANMVAIKIKQVIVLGVSMITFSTCKYAEKTTYVFPPNQDGWFAIIYNCESGIKIPKVSGRRNIVIPTNRILILSNEIPRGILDNKFYITNSGGEQIEIEIPDTNTSSSAPYKICLFTYYKLAFNKAYYIKSGTPESKKNKMSRFDNILLLKVCKSDDNSTVNSDSMEYYKSQLIEYILQNNIECITEGSGQK